MNKDFNNNIPIFSKRKMTLKTIAILLLVMFIFLAIEIYYGISELIVMTALLTLPLLIYFAFLAIDMYNITKIIRYRDNTEVLDEFKVSSPKHIFMLIILIILSVYIFPQSIVDPNEDILRKLIYIVALIVVFVMIYKIYTAGKYSINIIKRSIRILFKNQEIGSFKVENIALAKFSRSDSKMSFFILGSMLFSIFRKVDKKGKYPIMQLFNFKGEEFFKISLSIKNYWLMKKYFLKYNVRIEDLCDFLNDDI